MSPFRALLRTNRNYRYTWFGQVVSEVGDHFNTIAVLSLTLNMTGSGVAVGGVMVARVVAAILAGPLAGVALDRFDRKQVMIASDLVRCVIAVAFVLIPLFNQSWLLYVLSGLLMFASPFFTSGRMAILPRITSSAELHTANALMQTTAWLTLSIGTMLGGISAGTFGYDLAFLFNAASFLFSALAISRVRSPSGGFCADHREGSAKRSSAWFDFTDSLRYMWATPLIFAIGMAWVGWATGGGAAQVLFTLFGEIVYQGGPAAIGIIWGSAGFGLVIGGLFSHRLGPRLDFPKYKHAITIALLVHGIAYVAFALMPTIAGAVVCIMISRVAMGTINVLNRTTLLTHVPDRYRGRVYSTIEMMMNTVMMLSLTAGSIASEYYPVRTIGVVAGLLSTSTAFFWAWANYAGRLPEPVIEPEKLHPPEESVAPRPLPTG